MREAVGERLARALGQRRLRIAEPARRGRVGGESFREQQLLALGLRRLVAAQDRQRIVRRQDVVDVAEVDARDELLRRHVREELPERLLLELRVQIPDRVDDGGRGKVDHALLRSQPAQLAVGDESPPQPSEVCDELLDRRPDHVRRERLDRGDADLGAAADREREPVPRQAARIVGLEGDVGRRIVGIRVHRIRPGTAPRGREADVVRDGPHDPHGHEGMFLA